MQNKKIITSVVAAVATVVLAASANAAVVGPYVEGQLGWGDTHIKGFSTSDFPASEGFSNVSTSTSGTTGLAGRLSAGYQFDPNWAVELGYTKFHNLSSRASGNFSGNGISGSFSASGTVKENAWDLVAKGMAPLGNNFDGFAKLGVAYLQGKGSASAYGYETSSNENKLFPTASLGVDYDITPNVVTDLSYTRIQKTGGSNSDLNSTDFVGLGLAYHFG